MHADTEQVIERPSDLTASWLAAAIGAEVVAEISKVNVVGSKVDENVERAVNGGCGGGSSIRAVPTKWRIGE